MALCDAFARIATMAPDVFPPSPSSVQQFPSPCHGHRPLKQHEEQDDTKKDAPTPSTAPVHVLRWRGNAAALPRAPQHVTHADKNQRREISPIDVFVNNG
jgi:hypothetical protein